MTADDEANERANVTGTRNAVALANALEAGTLHHASSVAVTGALQGPVPRGHVRRGPEAALVLPPHEVRVREDRARGVDRPVARLPPRGRHRPLADRRDGQDRRALLLLQGDPEGAPRAAASGSRSSAPSSATRTSCRSTTWPPRWTTSPTSPASTARPSTSGAQVAALGRGAQHLRQRRPRAADGDPHRQAPDRRAAQGRRLDADAAAGAQGRAPHDAGRLRDPRGGHRPRRLHRPVRHARHRARAGRQRASRSRRWRATPSASGTTGSASSTPTSTRTARSRPPSTGAPSSSPARRAASAARRR